jgi:hypothetical protein
LFSLRLPSATRVTNGTFPLTPALSLGEREDREECETGHP